MNSQQALDRSFLALAHPARRAIVERLAAGPATVAEASRGLALSKPAISKHLRVLEGAGVLRRRIEGRTHRLELSDAPLADAEAWLERQRRLWEAKFDEVDRFLATGRRATRKEDPK